MFNIDEEVFVVDLADKPRVVAGGIVVGTGISTTGYPMYDIKTKNDAFSKEAAYVCGSQKDANEKLAEFMPIYHKMTDIRKKAQAELDTEREKILGKPIFTHLLEKTKKEKR